MDNLYWTPHHAVHDALQNYGPVSKEAILKKLDTHYDWLLSGVSGFKQPNEESRKHVNDGKPVSLKGKKFPVDAKFKGAAVKLSVLLDLDEFQTLILLTRWVKAAAEEVPESGEVHLSNDQAMQVLAYYHQERLLLLKCIQFMLLQGTADTDLASLVARLVKAGLEERMAECLRLNLDQGMARVGAPAGPGAAAQGLMGRMTAVIKEFGSSDSAFLSSLHSTLREQLQQERAELLTVLLLLYEAAGVSCSSSRVLSLVSMLGDAMFPSSPQQAAAMEAQQKGASQLMAEHLACLLVLSALDLSAYIALTSSNAQPLTPDELPLGGKVRDVHSKLRAWPASPTSVSLLLTWSAVVRLLEPYVELGEGAVEELQSRAQAAGMFDSLAQVLALQDAHVGGALALVYRGVMVKATALLATAFELGTAQLGAATWAALMKYLRALVAGHAQLCTGFWDPEQELFEPLRVMLHDACASFPALLAPFLDLLALFSHGPTAAASAYAYLQTSPRMLVLHDAQDPALQPLDGRGGVVLRSQLPWSLAPEVASMVLPEGIEGQVAPIPAALPQPAAGCVAVAWDVRTPGSSFGPLLLLARACQCLLELERAAGMGARGDVPGAARQQQAVQDLSASLALLSSLAEHAPAEVVPDLMALSVDLLQPQGLRRTWLDVAAGSISVLCQLPSPPLDAIAHGLTLLRGIALFHPQRVLALLPQLPLLAAEPSPLEPAQLPLAALPTADVGFAGAASALGLLPRLSAFQSEVEGREGRYPATLALLRLLGALLEHGWVGGPLPAYVLHVLGALLPTMHQRQFKSGEARWELSSAALRVCRLALTSRTQVTDDPKAEARELPAPGSMGLAGGAGGPQLCVTGLAGHVMKQLLLYGGALLLPSLPPRAEALAALRLADLQSKEAAALEGAVAELLQLLVLLLGGAAVLGPGLPLEDFLFASASHGSSSSPAAILCSYLSYSPADQADLPPEQSLSFLALAFLRALLACLGRRPAGSAGAAGASVHPYAASFIGTALPAGSPAIKAVKDFFQPQVALRCPAHFAAAVDILELAMPGQPELLDALLLPSGLDPREQAEDISPAAAAPTPAKPDGAAPGAPGSSALVLAKPGELSAAGAAPRHKKKAPAWSALDGLAELLQRAASLRRKQPQVLAHVLRAVAAMWEHRELLHQPLQLLRAQRQWSALLEQCLPAASELAGSEAEAGGSAAAGASGASLALDPWRQLAEAHAWKLLTMEAFSRSAVAATAAGDPVLALLEKVAGAGVLPKLLRRYSTLGVSPEDVQRLGQLLAATCLELGACGVAGLWGPGREDMVALAQDVRKELESVAAMLARGEASHMDLRRVHAHLAGQDGDSDAAATSGESGPTPPPADTPLYGALMSQPPGRALLCHSRLPLPLSVLPVAYGPGYLYDAGRLVSLLGPCALSPSARRNPPTANQDPDFEVPEPPSVLAPSLPPLLACLSDLGEAASLGHARLCALHAACTLCAVLPKCSPQAAKQLAPAGMAACAVDMCKVGLSELQSWGGSSSLGPLAAPCGLAALQRLLVSQVACCCKFLQQSLAHVKAAAAAGTGAGGTASAAGSATPSRASSLGIGLGLGGAMTTPSRGLVLTPSGVGSRRASETSGGSAAGSAAGAAIPAEVCVQVVSLLSAWLKVVGSGSLAQCRQEGVVVITDALTSSCLLALQLGSETAASAATAIVSASTSSPLDSDTPALQTALLSCLPGLCHACWSGTVTTALGMQLLMEVVTRQLPPADWLPIIRSQLDLRWMLAQAGARVGSYAMQPAAWSPSQDLSTAGDLGMLQLAVAIAQVPQGACLLAEQGVMEQLTAMARMLLAPQGGGLAAFPVDVALQWAGAGGAGSDADVSGSAPSTSAASLGRAPSLLPGPATAGGGSSAVDLGGAYYPGGAGWSPVHQQWCTLLSFMSVITRALGQFVDVERPCMDFLVAAEPRLLLACQAPAGDALQPLSLAMLVELERALFLLARLARHSGAWHLMLPGSLAKFRIAAASFVGFAALPNSRRGYSVACPPQSPAERAMMAQDSGIPNTDGWFRVCSAGCGEQQGSATAGASGQSDAPAAAGPSGGSSGAPLVPGMCSAYSARLAELVYTCAHHALAFLMATSPNVSEAEASSLGPMWPSPRDLACLQEQGLAVLAVLAEGLEGRRKHITQLLVKVLQLSSDFLDVLGQASARVRNDKLREQVSLIERCLARGERLPSLSSIPVPLSPMLSASLSGSLSIGRSPSLVAS